MADETSALQGLFAAYQEAMDAGQEVAERVLGRATWIDELSAAADFLEAKKEVERARTEYNEVLMRKVPGA